MAGLFDYHIILALEDQWANTYKPDNVLFRQVVRDVPEATADEWHAALVGEPIDFVEAWPTTVPERPLVIVQVVETPEQQVLGRLGKVTNTAGSVVLERYALIGAEATITITGPHPVLTRALHAIVEHIMLGGADAKFQEAGWMPPLYEGSGPLTPDDSSLPDRLGMFVIEQRWSSRREMRRTSTATKPTKVEAAHVDSIHPVSGNAGLITPE